VGEGKCESVGMCTCVVSEVNNIASVAPLCERLRMDVEEEGGMLSGKPPESDGFALGLEQLPQDVVGTIPDKGEQVLSCGSMHACRSLQNNEQSNVILVFE